MKEYFIEIIETTTARVEVEAENEEEALEKATENMIQGKYTWGDTDYKLSIIKD